MRAAILVIALGGCKIWSGSYASPGDDDAGMTTGDDDAPVGGQDITIELYVDSVQMAGATANGQLVAVQSGDGPFVAVTGQGGIYHARIHDERFGVAIGCRSIQGTSSVELVQQTISDGTLIQRPTCAAGDLAVTLDGSVSNLDASTLAEIVARANSSSVFGTSGYQMKMVRGPTDVFATLTDFELRPQKIMRQPTFDLEIPTTVSFNASDAVAFETAPLTVTPTNVNVGAQLAVQTPTGLYYIDGNGMQNPTSYNMLPASLRRPGDLMALEVSGGNSGGSVIAVTANGGPLSIELPGLLTMDLPTLSINDPYPRPDAPFPTSPTSLPIVTHDLRERTADDSGGDERIWHVTITAAWRLASHQASYTLPDLSGVPGFVPALALATHHQIGMFVTRRETNEAKPVDGQRIINCYEFSTVGEYCGDGIVQPGEQCEPPNSTGCSATCQSL